jgi:tripeptidyl-peptidase-1
MLLATPIIMRLLGLTVISCTVSDPKHHRYGQHLSQADINDLIKPSDKCLSQIHDWLLDNDIVEDQLKYSPAKDWIKVTLPVASIEKLLNTSYYVFKHEDGTQLVRAPEW